MIHARSGAPAPQALRAVFVEGPERLRQAAGPVSAAAATGPGRFAGGRKARPMRKRRTREHVIADRSVHHVEGFVLRCGWTVERTRHDYGIDLFRETYHVDGEVENGWVSFQLKAT